MTVTQPVIEPFRENALLRTLSLIGPVAALLLLGLSYPLVRLGLLIAAASGALALVMNRFDPYAGVALIAAVTFPALGLVLRRARVSDWFVATGLSLTGVLFVSALGATKDSVLGLEPPQLEAVCAEARQEGEVLQLANLLCPGNIAVSGHRTALARLEPLALAVRHQYDSVYGDPGRQDRAGAVKRRRRDPDRPHPRPQDALR